MPTTEQFRNQLVQLLQNFGSELRRKDLRSKVIKLIPAYLLLRNLGISLVDSRSGVTAARDRILYYFKKYPHKIINGKELMVVAGISEWARRVRELRVQFGWKIINGITALEMSENGDFDTSILKGIRMKSDDYILLEADCDREGAHRWNMANEIRKRKIGAREKILEYFKLNVGKQIVGDELKYVSGDSKEWARRVRELRTEYGWTISTKFNGRPDLPNGAYVLESVRQGHSHDRRIPDEIRGKVLIRDNYSCISCGWGQVKWSKSDPRNLEIHHKELHSKGGKNTVENLITLCNVCHDDAHKKK